MLNRQDSLCVPVMNNGALFAQTKTAAAPWDDGGISGLQD